MKRLLCTFLAVLMLFSITVPRNVQASASVKIIYGGSTRTYTNAKKKTYVYINGKKKTITQTPVFLKSGCYMGPLVKLFISSSFGVKYTKSGKKVTLTYKGNKLTLTDGSTDVVLNGRKEKNALLTPPMKGAKYSGTTASRWIVPIRSVCVRLGIPYELKDGVIMLGTPDAVSTVKKTATVSAANAVGSSSSTTAAKASTTAAGNKVVLVMDAGHGGIDSGATGNGYREKNFTLAILLGAKKYFDNDSRFKVYYTRTADTYPSLDDRCRLANNQNADLFISVHINSASASARGTETLYNNKRSNTTKKNGITSKNLAYAIQKAVLKSTGFPDRGLVNRTDLRVLNKTNMPACLIEYGFISNSTEAKIMHANTSRYGKDLYQAIVNYLKTEKKIK